jgi:GntR family transcriptional regulator / MocR family aminotransferase
MVAKLHHPIPRRFIYDHSDNSLRKEAPNWNDFDNGRNCIGRKRPAGVGSPVPGKLLAEGTLNKLMAAASAPPVDWQTLALNPDSKEPLYRQLHSSIVRAIQQGTYPAGARMPALQEIATQLQVSRSTVRRAFSKLASEGHLTGNANAGFYVPAVKEKRSPRSAPKKQAKRPATEGAVAVRPENMPVAAGAVTGSQPFPFNRPSAIEQIDLSRLQPSGAPRPFRAGFAETREFPLEIWEGLRSRLLRERAAELLDFSGTFGYLPLREAIAARLRNARGVKCSAEQVIITAGSQLALTLAIQTVVSPGDVAGMEEPGAYGVKAALQHAGARVAPLLVDEEGLNVPDSRRQNPPVLIYATPSNQFPLGAALSLSRRLEVLNYAHKSGAWIIEDDSDGDFCYSGHPLPSLQGSDHQNRVIYLGTTGRTLFSSLEIGYLVAPLSLMENFSKVREIIGGNPSVIDQATLALFLTEGHFDRHVRRMNLIYYQRLQALSESVQSELSGFIDLEPPRGGLHAVGWLARGLEENVVLACAATAGIELPLVSSFGKTALVRPGVVFGFASFSEKMIRQAVRTLGQALRSPHAQKALPAPGETNQSRKLGFLRRILPKRV